MNWSYKLGSKAIELLTANAKEFTRAASMLGVFIVGALTSNYGRMPASSKNAIPSYSGSFYPTAEPVLNYYTVFY